MTWAVLLVGHGAPAHDTPRPLVTRLRALEAQRRAMGQPVSEEERALDARIRRWPRTPATDPYMAGIEELRRALADALGGVRAVAAFNEFCAPSVPEAIQVLVDEGVARIVVTTTMMTPGGVHSDKEIPEALAEARRAHPAVEIAYAWPFAVPRIAALLAQNVLAWAPPAGQAEPERGGGES